MAVFDTGKRYNSAFSIAFSVDHDKEDASDLTPLDFTRAILLRLEEVSGYGASMIGALYMDDTMENPDLPPLEEEEE